MNCPLTLERRGRSAQAPWAPARAGGEADGLKPVGEAVEDRHPAVRPPHEGLQHVRPTSVRGDNGGEQADGMLTARM